MQIKVSTLKHFQKLASSLRANNILPILRYLKFEPGKITKTVLNSFVEFDCKDVTETMLIDEGQLFGMVGNTNSEFLVITKKGNKVTISDTKKPLTFQVPAVEEFPIIPVLDTEKIEVSPEFVEGLYMASFFSLDKELIPTVKSFIMIGNRSISASDGFIVFTKPITESLEMVVEKRAAVILSKMNITACAKTEKYNFFFANGVVMGFAIQEIGFCDMTVVFRQTGNVPTFTADPSDFLSFNHLAMQSVDGDPYIYIKTGELFMNDAALNVTLNQPMECLAIEDDFVYLPSQMNRLLSAISCAEADFYKGDKKYYIKDKDNNFTTLIQGINFK